MAVWVKIGLGKGLLKLVQVMGLEFGTFFLYLDSLLLSCSFWDLNKGEGDRLAVLGY